MVGSIGTDPTLNFDPEWSPDGTRILWSGTVWPLREVWVADADGHNRAQISGVSPDPTFNSQPQWQPRAGDLALGSTATALVVGQAATMTVTVTSTCPHGNVVIGGIAAMGCLGSSAVGVSQGSLAGSTWQVGALNGTATATITGTVTTPGACAGTASVIGSQPMLATAPTKTFGGTATGSATTTTTVPAGVDPNSCFAPTDPFTDVSATSFARADITCIFNLGITSGTSAITYDSSANVTREQAAAFLARLWRAAIA